MFFYHIYALQVFSFILWLAFCSPKAIVSRTEIINCNEIKNINLIFLHHSFCIMLKKFTQSEVFLMAVVVKNLPAS